jgi:hypothetical protein
MSHQTMVFGSSSRRSEKWRVYQVRTANSTYELEVEGPTPGDPRRCCVLTCVAPAHRAGEAFEDSAPRAGDQSLYAISPLDWIGKALTVGTARTSEVQSVEFIKTLDGPASPRRTRAGSGSPPPREAPPSSQAPRPWSPFPLGYVEMAEAAASVLQVLCHRREELIGSQHDPRLRKRLQLALASCRLMLESLPEDR